MHQPERDDLLTMFWTMTTIHTCDERLRLALNSGEVTVSYYPIRGQEAIPSGLAPLLNRDDYVVTTYRGLHDLIGRGVPLRGILAEMLGKADGTSKGKGGPMHVADPDSGLMLMTGVVGSGIPIANGLALASQFRQTSQVTVVNFGDGATSIGAFHEAMNLAAVWQLPVVFVCQNNQYAEGTPFTHYTRTPRLADRAAAYSMPGVTVDGNDPVAVYRVAKEAIDRARSGGGPTLIECGTYRLLGHYYGDPAAYVPEDERAAAWERDPVPAFRSWLLNSAEIPEDALATIEAAVAAEVEDAFAFALASPPPSIDELYTDVFLDEKAVPR